MSEHNAQQSASPQQAQGVTNTAPGEGPAKPADYGDFEKQLQDLTKQLDGASTAEAMAEIAKKIQALEAEVAKKATKKTLSKKLSDMKKQFSDDQDDDDDEDDDNNDDEQAEAKKAESAEAEADAEADAEAKKAEAAKRSGKGIVAVDQLANPAFGSNFDWFKDLMKANEKRKKAFL